MSAYLHRLITRDQTPAAVLSPFVRSRSPIAELDQRLAVDEGLGHGLAQLEPAEPELGESLPSPQPFTVPTPASAPESIATTIQRKLATPLTSEAHSTASSTAPSTRARSPRLDPGPLFDLDPTPRYFDETRIHEIVHESAPTSFAPEPRITPSPVVESRFTPFPVVEPRITPDPAVEPNVSPQPALEPRTSPIPAQAFAPTPAPWRTFEPAAPIVAPAVSPARPELVPLAPTSARLEPSPRAHQPIAAHPAELPTIDSVQVQTPRSVQVHIGQVDIEIVPSNAPARSAPPRKARFDIESVSQIGPLARHFPNRRGLRLRYR